MSKGTDVEEGYLRARMPKSEDADLGDGPLWEMQYRDRPDVTPIHPPSPGGEIYRADMSAEMLKDLTQPNTNTPDPQYRLTAAAFEQAYQKLKRERLAMDYGMSPLRYAAAELEAASQQAAATIDRVMLGVVHPDSPMFDDFTAPCPPNIDDQGERLRLGFALVTYARQFYIPAREAETPVEWLARVEGKMRGAPMDRESQPFRALLKSFVAAAMAMSMGDLDDELDNLIGKQAPARPSITGSSGAGKLPYNTIAPPVHSSPADPLRCKCGDPLCNGGRLVAVDPLPRIPTVPLDPKFKAALTASPAKKDSLLNPPVKGFIGSDKYGYDPDVD